MEEYIKNNLIFFKSNNFFDYKIKKKIQHLSGIDDFQKLIIWCSETCYKNPKYKIEYIGNEKYVSFFLFYIFRHKEIISSLWNIAGSNFEGL